VALGSLENEGSEYLMNTPFNSPHEQHDQGSIPKDLVMPSPGCRGDDMPQPWETFHNQSGTKTGYSLLSASNLAAATPEGADLNVMCYPYSTYTGHNWPR